MDNDTFLDEGVYTLKVVAVQQHPQPVDGSIFIVELENKPLQQSAFLYTADNETSRRNIWGDMVDHFEDMPRIVGHTYLFPIRVVKLIGGERANSVRAPLAEVVV